MSTADQHPVAPDDPHQAPAGAAPDGSQASSQAEPQANGGPEPADTPGHNKGPIAAKTSDLKDKFSDKKGKVKEMANPPGGFDATPFQMRLLVTPSRSPSSRPPTSPSPISSPQRPIPSSWLP